MNAGHLQLLEALFGDAGAAWDDGVVTPSADYQGNMAIEAEEEEEDILALAETLANMRNEELTPAAIGLTTAVDDDAATSDAPVRELCSYLEYAQEDYIPLFEARDILGQSTTPLDDFDSEDDDGDDANEDASTSSDLPNGAAPARQSARSLKPLKSRDDIPCTCQLTKTKAKKYRRVKSSTQAAESSSSETPAPAQESPALPLLPSTSSDNLATQPTPAKCTDAIAFEALQAFQYCFDSLTLSERKIARLCLVPFTFAVGPRRAIDSLDACRGSKVQAQLFGRPICPAAFDVLTATASRTWMRTKRDAIKGGFEPPRKRAKGTDERRGRKGQRAPFLLFMKWVITHYGLPNPGSRGSNDVVLLPKSFTKRYIYDQYKRWLKGIEDAANALPLPTSLTTTVHADTHSPSSALATTAVAILTPNTGSSIHRYQLHDSLMPLPAPLQHTQPQQSPTATTPPEGEEATAELKPVTYESFCRLWSKLCPQLKQGNSRTDVCGFCKDHSHPALLSELHEHLKTVKQERDAYIRKLKRTKTSCGASVHISFDYSQNIRLPMFVDEPKQLFFKSGKVVDIFGIANTTERLQFNYLLEEGKWARTKGPDGVISLVHHYLTKCILTDDLAGDSLKTLYIMADNCASQNKNRWMLRYLSLVSAYFNLDINYQFLVAGHTKFFPDACFGVMKKKFRMHDVMTANDAVKLTEASAQCNKTFTASDIRVYSWKRFLDEGCLNFDWTTYTGTSRNGRTIPNHVAHVSSLNLHTIKNISKKHHFEFRARRRGVVFAKDHINDDWEEFNVGVDPELKIARDRHGRNVNPFTRLNWYVIEPQPLEERRVAELEDIKKIFYLGNPQYAALADEFFLRATEDDEQVQAPELRQ